MIQDNLTGSGVGQALAFGNHADALAREDPADVSMQRKVQQATDRADGSCTVDLTEAESLALWDRAETLIDVAGQNVPSPREIAAGWADGSALGELNAARALCRQLARHQKA